MKSNTPASITSGQSVFDNNKRIELILKSSKASILLIDNLVNDLLDYAKLENASLKLDMNYFNLSQEIDMAISMMSWNAEKRGVDVAVFSNPKATKYLKAVFGDRVRICRIILNLLSNSIKFTSQNGNVWIEVNVRKIKLSDEGDTKPQKSNYTQPLEEIPVRIELRVRDNGIGISKEDIKNKLFVDFGMLDQHAQINPYGTGLGLSICKLLATKMNGVIDVESQVGVGTTFIFSFKTKCKLNEGKVR